MTLQQFKSSLSQAQPPEALSSYARALWLDAKGDWRGAHETIQDLSDNNASWIHAYLHRKEGDIWNADYWYSRAAKKRPTYSLEEELDKLVEYFIAQ